MHPLVSLTKLSVENYVRERKIISSAEDLPAALGEPRLWRKEFLSRKAGTFVTIEKNGAALSGRASPNKIGRELRGCIGTYLPTRENVAEEIIHNAIAAAAEDYRFGPIREEELPHLSYTVYILGEPELVEGIKELDPKKYGIIVKTIPIKGPTGIDVVLNGHFVAKTGLLLPDLEGVDMIEKQISIACQKGGIDPLREKILIYRFTVEKYQ